MRLYLIQHAKAMAKEENRERPLNDEGRADAAKMARFLKRSGPAVGQIWHSGKRRAGQTADIYSESLGIPGKPTAREGLGPNDNVALLRDELAVETTDTMIVGHMPFVSRLATLLLTGYESPAVVTFINAGIVCLERTKDGRWTVEWIVTPDSVAE
jgi:phosphohistidine phosphatase